MRTPAEIEEGDIIAVRVREVPSKEGRCAVPVQIRQGRMSYCRIPFVHELNSAEWESYRDLRKRTATEAIRFGHGKESKHQW